MADRPHHLPILQAERNPLEDPFVMVAACQVLHFENHGFSLLAGYWILDSGFWILVVYGRMVVFLFLSSIQNPASSIFLFHPPK
jgi:hypothetical protein